MTYEIRDITKTYGGKTVLKLEQLDIYENQIFGLVGPSGSGKSTLLRLLNFVESVDSGHLYLWGQGYHKENMPDLKTRRLITTVFQTPALMTTSVLNNILYPLKIRNQRINYEEIDQIVEKLGLSPLKHQRADKLSGGEAQRVSLARAIVFKPGVWLRDEPTANLDPANVKIIEDMILDFVANERSTVIMVTHNVFQAKRMADRVGLLYKGELVEVKEKDAFFDAPSRTVTSDFLSGDLVY